ncbi:MAG: hypothetical protein WC327_02750 [Candidatus Cloacimonadia bacterium]
MKKTLLLCIILLAGFAIANLFSLELESEYQSYFDNVSFLNNYFYLGDLPASFKLQHSGEVQQYRNKRFHRYSRNANLVWRLSNESLFLHPAIHFDYDGQMDKAKPDLEQYEIIKTKKKAGIDFHFSPLDSLSVTSDITYIFSDEYNSAHSNLKLKSEGYHNINRLRYYKEGGTLSLLLSSHFDQLSLDFDDARDYGADINLKFLYPDIDTRITFQRNSHKIYLLNEMDDIFRRSFYQASSVLNHTFSPYFALNFGENFRLRDNKFSKKRERNYLESENLLFFNTKTDVARFGLILGGEYQNTSRSFKEEINSRRQEIRSFNGGLNYTFSEQDSLVYKRTLSLQKTDYLHSSNTLDNDLLVDENLTSFYLNLRQNIRLTTHFNYIKREDIYIRKEMSANNKTSRSYNLRPSLNIGLTPNILALQEYLLRADYDDYFWSEVTKDRMYRKFSASYSLIYKLPPENNDYQLAVEPETLFERNNLLLGVSLIYDTNNSGVLEQKAYRVLTENEYYTLQFELFRRIERLELYFKPRFIWSTTIDNTEKFEFNHLFDITYYRPDRYSNFRLTVNPTGTSISNLTWRINATVTFVI